MRASVYVETTIPSYLAARPSRDLVVAARQQVTWDWWRVAEQRFELYVSHFVLEEARRGDPEAAARRLELIEGLPVLPINDEIRRLAESYRQELRFPVGPGADLLHVAFAAWHEVDYLLTWNCSHLANGQVIRKLMEANLRLNRFTPLIVTPDVLLGEETGEIP